MLEIGTVSMNFYGQKLLLELESPYQLKGSWVCLLRCFEMVSIILPINDIRRYLFTMVISLPGISFSSSCSDKHQYCFMQVLQSFYSSMII